MNDEDLFKIAECILFVALCIVLGYINIEVLLITAAITVVGFGIWVLGDM